MSSELEGVGAGDNDLRKKNTPPNCPRISMYWSMHMHTQINVISRFWFF